MGPELLAFEMGVHVVEDRLPKGWLGAYHHGSRTVTLAPGLNLDPVRYRCVLGHELGHAHYGHTPDDYPEGEWAADKFAAKLLIRLDDYLEAMAATGDVVAAARVLGVLPWVVRAFQKTMNGGLFTRTGLGLMAPAPFAEPGSGLVCPPDASVLGGGELVMVGGVA